MFNVIRTKSALVPALFGLAAACTGCGSMFTGTTQSVSLDNLPPHAKVLVDGTPVDDDDRQVDLDKGNDHTVQIQATGYEPKTVAINKQIQGVYWVNLLNGVGLIVDLGTGGAYELTPAVVDCSAMVATGKPPGEPTASAGDK